MVDSSDFAEIILFPNGLETFLMQSFMIKEYSKSFDMNLRN